MTPYLLAAIALYAVYRIATRGQRYRAEQAAKDAAYARGYNDACRDRARSDIEYIVDPRNFDMRHLDQPDADRARRWTRELGE